MPSQRAPAHDHHELVVARDADLVDADHIRVLAHLRELDRLVVPVRAERRVDAAGEHRGNQVGADVDLLDGPRRHTLAGEDRLKVGVLIGDPRVPDALAAQLGDRLDALGAERHDRGERLLDDRRDGHQGKVAVAREHHLGLVGHRRVYLARGQQLERARGIRRHLDVNAEARPREIALGQGLVDPHMVGVGEPVEHQRQRLGAPSRRGDRLVLLAARREQHTGEGHSEQRDQAFHAGRSPSGW